MAVVLGQQVETQAPLLAAVADDPAVADALWWVHRLHTKLVDRLPRILRMEDYYRGEYHLPTLHERARGAFARLLRMSRANWGGLIVDAAAERIRVTGFRVGEAEDADQAAWQVWQANNFDAVSGQLVVTTLTTGYGYALVEPNPDNPETPRYYGEHPAQMICARRSDTREYLAALKVWLDEWTGVGFATLYLPDAIWKFQAVGPATDKLWTPSAPQDAVYRSGWTGEVRSRWEPRGDPWPVANPLGRVPVVEFLNRPDLCQVGRSEIDDVTDIIDRASKTLADRLIAQEFVAFPQKWATGIELEDGPDGQPRAPYDIGMDRLLTSENENARFGVMQQGDLKPYIDAVESDVKTMASISRTPAHYLLNVDVLPSGDSLRASEAGLAAKVKHRMRSLDDAWEDLVRLGFLAAGDPRARETYTETLYADPEVRTVAQQADASTKLYQANILPLEATWESLGYSPSAMERMRQQMRAEALTRAAVTFGTTPAG